MPRANPKRNGKEALTKTTTETEPVPPKEIETEAVAEVGPTPATDTYIKEGEWKGYPNPKALEPWDYLNALNQPQWSQHAVYVYRNKPRTIDPGSGKGRYLDIYNTGFTLEEIRERFGGGKFLFIVERGSKNLLRFFETVAGKPILQKDWGEQLANPPVGEEEEEEDEKPDSQIDDKLLKMLTFLVNDSIRQRDKAMESGREFDPNQALNQSIAQMHQMYGQSVDFILKQTAKIQGGQAQGPMDQLMTTLLGAVVKKLVEPEDPLSRIDTMLTLMDRLGSRGGGGGGADTPWVVLAQHAPEMLGHFKGITSDLMRITELRVLGKYNQPSAAVVQPSRPAAAPMGGPWSGAPQPTAAPAAEPAPQGATVNVQPVNQQALQEYGNLLYNNLIVEMMHQGDDPETVALAAWRMNGQVAIQLAEALKRKDPRLAQDESFRHVFACQACRENLEEFVRDFCKSISDLQQFGEIQDTDEPEEDDKPPSP